VFLRSGGGIAAAGMLVYLLDLLVVPMGFELPDDRLPQLGRTSPPADPSAASTLASGAWRNRTIRTGDFPRREAAADAVLTHDLVRASPNVGLGARSGRLYDPR
jgi:hypothetical protein